MRAESSGRDRDTLVPALGLLSVGALALLVWLRMDPVAFQGADGKGFQTHILNYLGFAAPFEVNILNPLQGAFTPQLPLNTWLNPGYLVFRLFDWDSALIASLAASWLSLAIPTYFLGRAAGLTGLPATIAAQATAFVLPPFLFLFGFNTQFMIVPPTMVTVGVQTLLLVLLLRMSTTGLAAIATNGVVIAGMLYVALIVDPLYFIAGFLAMIPFAGVFILASASLRLALARAAACVVGLCVLYALGGIDYLIALIQFTARDFFKAEIGRGQLPTEASMLFAHPLDFGRTMLFVGGGWLLGVWLDRGPRRVLAVACIAHWLFVLAQGAVYVLAYLDWPGVAPMYLEQAAYHVYLLGALSGWWALGERISARRQISPAPIRVRTASLVALLSPVALAVAWYASEAVPANKGAYTEPWPDQRRLLEAMRSVIGLPRDSERRFGGTAAVLEIPDSYHKTLTLDSLWRDAIPTANEYSQLFTPSMYYFATRLLVMGTDALNGLKLPDMPPQLGGLLGIRFTLSGIEAELPESTLVGTLEGFTVTNQPVLWFIHAIPDPNLGDYSPTDVHRAATGREALAVLAEPGFDFRRSVVVGAGERLPSLVAARSSSMSVDRGRIRLSAQSDRTSLIVLPVQYSQCLRLASADGARLVRVNYLLAGVVFTGRIESEISYNFGFHRSGCRKQDLRDLADLGVAADTAYSPAAEFRHPLAARQWSELGTRMKEIWRRMRAAASADRRDKVRFDGPITRQLRAWFH